MNWPLRASTMAAIVLCASATASAAAPASRAEWSGAVVRQLQRHLSMPREAHDLEGPLNLRLRLTVLRDGKIDKVALASSSGYAAVDEAAAGMVRRASPLPAFAPDMAAEKEIVMLPVRFQTEGQAPQPSSSTGRQYADPARGFGVTVPAPYRILRTGRTPEFDVLVQVASAPGAPPAAGAADALCGIGFAAPRKTLKTRPGAGMPHTAEARLAAAEAAQAERGVALEERQAFELHGARGVDFVAPPASGPDRDRLLQYTALVDTLTLRVAMNCTTTRDGMAAALPAFRRIRDGISLGRP
ncbi:MAG: energy transducer TonB family protein [Achromobacter sp.]|uniref:energy transducer TonB family protein n=1 Tax=Achromobacter sp. TaxID=134375 RepID=UPI003CFE8FA3